MGPRLRPLCRRREPGRHHSCELSGPDWHLPAAGRTAFPGPFFGFRFRSKRDLVPQCAGTLALYLPRPARWSAACCRYRHPLAPDRSLGSPPGLVFGRMGSRRVRESPHHRCCSDRCAYSAHLLLVLLTAGDTNKSTKGSRGVTCLTSPQNDPLIIRSQPLLKKRKRLQGLISPGPGGYGHSLIFQLSVWNVCRHPHSSTCCRPS